MSGGGDHEDDGGVHLNGASLVILFVIITLTLGMFMRQLSKISGFPYTPLLIVIGALIGGFRIWGDITKAADNMMEIDPHSILILLLPLLIFESAYNAHTEVLTKNFWQVMLIVGPGVLMMTFFLAFIIYYVLGYGGDGNDEMSFESTLVLGTILATTDPVAVVALLKSLGAPLHIETLIEMESLFNDGVAMVFFSIFVKLAQGENLSFGDGLEEFFSLALGGPALGLGFGIVALIILNLFTRGTTLFITMVVLLAYSVFLTAEVFLEAKVSGLLALVVSGIVMNVKAKDYMTNKQKAAVAQILQYLQYVSETVLFFMSGVFIGDILIQDSAKSNHIEDDDWWKVFVLYFFLNLGRLLMFLILKWPLGKTGEGLSWKEMWVATWGGLRGALALALGLIIFAEEPKESGINARTQTLILFHVAAQASLTLLINGSTSGSLVEALKLIENTAIKIKFKQNYLKEVKDQANQQKEILYANSYFDMVEWKGVDQLINLDQLEQKQGWKEKYRFDQDFKKGNHKRQTHKGVTSVQNQENGALQSVNSLAHQNSGRGNSNDTHGFKRLQTFKDKQKMKNSIIEDKHCEEKYQKIRYDFLRIFMKVISSTKSKEWISKGVFQLIFDAAEENSEKLTHPISMWHLLKRSIASEGKLNLIRKMIGLPGIGKPMNYYFHSELSQIHEMIYIFTTVINDTKLYIKDHSVNIHMRNVRKTQDMNIIMKELDKDFYMAKDYMNRIKKDHYEVLGKLEQRKAAVKIIMAQAKMVDEHINNHYIPEKEGNEIKNYLSKKIEKLHSLRTLIKLTSQSENFIKLFFKDTLDQNEIDHLINCSTNETYEGDENVLELDEEVNYVYYIAQGEIEEIIYPVDEDVAQEKSSICFTQGQVVGLTNLVDPDEKSLIQLKAKGQTHLKALPIQELREYYFNNGAFEAFCLKKCLYQFLHLSQKENDLWAIWGSKNIDEINQIAQESKCIRLTIDETFRCEQGGYLYTGIIESLDGEVLIENYSLIPPGKAYIARDLSILLEFQKSRKPAINTLQINDNRGFKSKKNPSSNNQLDIMSNSIARQRKPSQQKIQMQRRPSQREGSFILMSKQNPQIPVFERHNSTKDQKENKVAKIHNNQRHMQGIKQSKKSDQIESTCQNIRNNQCQGDDGQLEVASMLQTNNLQTSKAPQIVFPQNSIRAQTNTNAINMEDMSMISINDAQAIQIEHQDSKQYEPSISSQGQNPKQYRRKSSYNQVSLHQRRGSHEKQQNIVLDSQPDSSRGMVGGKDQQQQQMENNSNTYSNSNNISDSQQASQQSKFAQVNVVQNNIPVQQQPSQSQQQQEKKQQSQQGLRGTKSPVKKQDE